MQHQVCTLSLSLCVCVSLCLCVSVSANALVTSYNASAVSAESFTNAMALNRTCYVSCCLQQAYLASVGNVGTASAGHSGAGPVHCWLFVYNALVDVLTCTGPTYFVH
eukprot:GHRR01015196.1.p1 GENE.GHRR01015196.1~~GHRR01015196.1.p1  ORF type:complete len:108 (-),score=18.23 GHRR01015196.1:532-855(-)